MKKILLFACLLVLLVHLPAWDDEELFYNSVKPNILFLLDSSGSMRNVIYHPDYVPGTGSSFVENDDGLSGMYDDWGETKWISRWHDGTTAYTTPPVTYYETGCYERVLSGGEYWYRMGSGGNSFVVGDTAILYSPYNTQSEGWGEIAEIYDSGSNKWVRLTNVHGGELDSNGDELGRFVPAGWDYMRFCVCRDSNYTPRAVKFWGGIDKMDSTQTASYQFNGAGETDDYFEWVFNDATDTQREQISHFANYGTFDLSDTTVHQNTYTRIQVAREALLGITDHPDFQDKVRIGMMEFNGGNGGYLGYWDGHYSEIRDIEDASDKADLMDIMDHMRADGSTPLGEALAETWRYFAGDSPYYSSRTGSGGSTYDSPCDLYCRKNFVVVISDGEPNADDNFFTVGGEYIHQVYDTEPVGWSGPDWDTVNVAKYLFNHDARPDLDETQNIEVYTIGFTTSGDTNTLLTEAATHGGGEFFQANDYDSLVEQFVEILGKIMEKLTSFSSFSAPKHSLTHGLRGYIATFIPRSNKARWQGFLKAYELDANGDFETDVTGLPINHIWDVPDLLDLRTYTGGPGSFGSGAGSGNRTLFTWLNYSIEHFYDANTNLTHDLLGLGSTEDALRTQIIEVVSGIENPWDYDNRFGDVFHFDPKVSVAPHQIDVLFNPAFQDFYDTYKDRDEVILVGANDGMLHCFEIDSGEELWGFIPPSSLLNLENIGFNLNHEFFVDGQAIIKNIQVDNQGNEYDWETITVFGQGLGGNSYYCMDITDPRTPDVKWQIGKETMDNGNLDDTVLKNTGTEVISTSSLFGKTMSLPASGPIKFKFNSGDEPTHIVVVSGGYDEAELTPDSTGGTREGKSLFILDADTGTVIKQFRHGSTTNSSEVWASGDFLYSMSAAPVLVDYDNDGYYDAIYQADIGGRIWKIDIGSTNRINWEPYLIFDTDAAIDEGLSSQPIFIAPTVGYGTEYNVWIFVGTGYRANPNDQSAIGHFYVFKDEFNPGSSPFTPDDLQDITTALKANYDNVDSDKDGYPDSQEQAEGTDPNDPYDYPVGVEPEGRMQLSDPDGFYFRFVHDTYQGEKMFSPSPIYIGGYLFFNTYLPPVDGGSGSDETCDPAGDLYVYSFKFSVLDGNITLDAPNVSKGRILGSGLLSGNKYKLYIGDGEIGSLPIDRKPQVGIEDSFGLLFWKENKYKIYQ